MPTFVLGRNPIGISVRAYQEHFQSAASAGERFMRIHLTYSPLGERAGEIDASVLKSWDEMLDDAGKRDLAVRPVLGRMFWWQDGYDQFEKADLCRHYPKASVATGVFVRGEDFTDFPPSEPAPVCG